MPRRSKPAASELTLCSFSHTRRLDGLPRVSSVAFRGMLLTLPSVRQRLTPTAPPPPDKVDGDFLPFCQ